MMLVAALAGGADLPGLYHAHQWSELREAVRSQRLLRFIAALSTPYMEMTGGRNEFFSP